MSEELPGNSIYLKLLTRAHAIMECENVVEMYGYLELMVQEILQKEVKRDNILHLDFSHRDKRKLKSAMWLAVKLLFKIYQGKISNKTQLLRDLVKEVDWNLNMNLKVGSQIDFVCIKNLLLHKIGN